MFKESLLERDSTEEKTYEKASGIRRSRTEAQSAGDGEILGLLTVTGAPKNPDVGRATTEERRDPEVIRTRWTTIVNEGS